MKRTRKQGFHNYEYDELYRLKEAKGEYTDPAKGENGFSSYWLKMQYDNLHNITHKELGHTVFGSYPKESNYELEYQYSQERPHQLSQIKELTVTAGEEKTHKYSYDSNGNMVHRQEDIHYRSLTWDEENRLMGVNDEGYASRYVYDDTGERVLKSSGGVTQVSVNGMSMGTMEDMKNYTEYLSPYFVFKEGSFTKHIYAGTERIVSQIGNGEFNNNSGGLGGNGITAGSLNFAQVQDWYEVQKEKYIASLGVPPEPPDKKGIYASPQYTGKPWPDFGSPLNSSLNTPPKGWPKMPVFNPPGGPPGPPVQFGPAQTNDDVNGGYGYSGTGTFAEDRYFYHHDHLGSSSYLTNQLGNITQHVEYIPFGEVFVEERNEKWNTPYLFNGKELDEETGLYYYGARYYSSKESVWLSVDPPLINGYYLDGNHDGGVYNSFNLAAYAYCRQNPVIYIDPDGNQFKVVNGFWQVSTFEKNSYGSNWGMNVLNYVGNVSAEIGNFGIGIVNTGLYYGQSALKGQSQNIVNNEVSGLKAIGGLFEGSLSGAVASWGTTDYWEGFGADATLTLLGGLVSGAGKSSAVSSVSTGTAAKGGLRSFDDVVASPKSLWGKSADEIGNMLGEGWTKGAYGSKGTGWKFTKGDQSIFYHPGGGRHGGSYYGFSSGKLGKNKIVGPDYKPSPSDKATIINTGN